MIYLFETDLPEKKPVFLSLTNIYGINKNTAFIICKKLGFSKNLKLKNLSKKQVIKLVKTVEILNTKLIRSLKQPKIKIKG